MKNKLTFIANFISNIFNAYIAIGLTLTLVICFAGNSVSNPAFVIFASLVLLFLNIVILKKLGIISDWEISNKNERPKFALSAMIPYTLILIFSLSNRSDQFLSISLVLIILNILIGIVSFFWKISGHMIYLSLLAYISFMLFNNLYLLIFWIIVLPIVGWSRVYLKRHTILQVVFGCIIGVLIPFILF